MFERVIFVLLITTAYNAAKSFPNGQGRIVGGEPANIDDYPYQVSITVVNMHNCGGSILNSKFILTAAHCTNNFSAKDLKVRAGTSLVNEGGVVVQVRTIIQHEQFDNVTFDYDLAILELEEPLEFGDSIAAIQLPAQDQNVAGDLDATATGWGRLSQNGPLPTQLQKVVLPTLAQTDCELVYGEQVTPRMFCAGFPEGGKDTCQGDSGGPLEADNVLIGITSWGDGCGDINSPGIYTKVSLFTDYIQQIVG